MAGEHSPTNRLHSLLGKIFEGKDDLLFFDVGAFRGDFTSDMLHWFPQARGILFEPTPACIGDLTARFSRNIRIQIHNVALSDETRTADYFLTDLPYNNSLLLPSHGPAVKIQVAVKALDTFKHQCYRDQIIDFIKIDAQGHDLQILKGAMKTLQQDRPAVLVEAIFVQLYERQDSYFDLFQFMNQQGYHLAGFFNAHATEDDALAFSDLFFVPAPLQQRLSQKRDRYLCQDPETLLEQNRFLQKACDERLAIIHKLEANRTLISAFKSRLKTFLKKQRWSPWAR